MLEKRILLQLFINSNIVLVFGILGGDRINITQVPFQLNYGDKCGGVLIDKLWAITTAHCGIEHFVRIANEHQLKGHKIQVVKHLFHPKYRFHHEYDFDVQLLKFRKGLHFSERVKKIGISELHDGIVRVAGWGYAEEDGEYSDLLQQVRLQIIPTKVCQAFKHAEYNDTLTDRMFCAGGVFKDACQGDSGGAAISMGNAVGISSFGHGCGRGVPGVYVNISHIDIRDWIREATGIKTI